MAPRCWRASRTARRDVFEVDVGESPFEAPKGAVVPDERGAASAKGGRGDDGIGEPETVRRLEAGCLLCRRPSQRHDVDAGSFEEMGDGCPALPAGPECPDEELGFRDDGHDEHEVALGGKGKEPLAETVPGIVAAEEVDERRRVEGDPAVSICPPLSPAGVPRRAGAGAARSDLRYPTYLLPSRGRQPKEEAMRRFSIALALAALLALPGSALAFHHIGLPATVCHAEAAGSPSNDNGMAKEALVAHNPHGLPLPPIGTPGQGQGQGGEHCANAAD